MYNGLTLYQNIQKHALLPYNVKNVTRLILLIKKGKESRASQHKFELFLALSGAVLKAINNFFSICKKCGVVDEKLIHEDEDIAAECYLVLENCLKNVNLQYSKMFFFYFNSGLNRAMFRLYKRNYEKYAGTIANTDDNEKYVLDKVKSTQHFDHTAIDLAGFSDIELQIIEHKINKGKLKDFLQSINLPSTQYYILWEGIQSKMFELYKNPETNKLEY